MNIQTDYIGAMVAEDFRTAAIFKKYEIDFCCKGSRTIKEACEKNGVDEYLIYTEIEGLPKDKSTDFDFTFWPLDLLADYIEKTHHQYVEEKTLVLQSFLDKLCKVHGHAHPELLDVRELFNESARDLSVHMKKEELILFPFIRNMVKTKNSGQELTTPHFVRVEYPVNMMRHEHEVEGERLQKISGLTNRYTPPEDACNTYKVTFSMLEDFENNLHTHIHLENNILFPKSIDLERELRLQ
ncbi:iron-sulfur cluster repair di-iron protein [Elizabethkingia argentiflava]|uniref:Iron-sulfur cluster repair di-iron protein n=1 Tax=Elizabethkingia argenteiflava TaxID=2681556 RepID=A0A845PUL9_9FLAO|nr:iron-sulfur cluster repair di-iron protein [Elizabethkingia argenteiflava]NAW51909.1 iron-sulfur cluster repair di-iron protein [Elizabethkingia argenteiflava]